MMEIYSVHLSDSVEIFILILDANTNDVYVFCHKSEAVYNLYLFFG